MQYITFRLCARLAVIVIAWFAVSGAASAHHPVPRHVNTTGQHVVIKRVEVPADVRLRELVRLAMQREVYAVKAAVQRQHALTVSHISWSPAKVVVIGHRLVQPPVGGSRSSLWLEEVRVTVPRQHLANSWDVHSLQKELERLGIKVKPRPPAPRPTSQISG